MTDYFVGIGGNDGNDGLSWANRKLTINGAEDVPIAAADTVYVGPGTYPEDVTCDVSGTSGNIITFIADVSGENTDGVGGVVRITGSNDNVTRTRNNCIDINSRSFRTFRGFSLDMADTNTIEINSASAVTDVIIEDCFLSEGSTSSSGGGILLDGGGDHTDIIIRRCTIVQQSYAIRILTDVVYGDSNILIENCFINSMRIDAMRFELTGGITVRNCTLAAIGDDGVDVAISALGTGTIDFTTVENCIITNCDGAALEGAATGDIIEDFNSLTRNGTDRTNTGTGASSNTNPPLFSPLLLLSGFNLNRSQGFGLADYSSLAAIAGNAEPTGDLFGIPRPDTASKNSWGAVQLNGIERETGTVEAGSVSLGMPDASRHQMFIPVTAVSTTFTVQCRRETNYAGTLPQMIIKQPGVADDVTVDTGSVNVWNELTTTLTPNADPPYLIMELVSNNTAASGSFAAFFDTITVT